MVVKKVSFDCTIAMPGYNNVKPGIVEADLEPGETLEEAWSELNQRAQAWHKKEFPHLYQENALTPAHLSITRPIASIRQVQMEREKDSEGSRMLTLMQAINSCESTKVLESYKLMVRSDQQLQDAYDNRLKELTK